MKVFHSHLLNIAKKLQLNDKVYYYVNGHDFLVGEVLENYNKSEISIYHLTDESEGITMSFDKNGINDFGKEDYFNYNLCTPIPLDYDELMEVLHACINLGKNVSIRINSEVSDYIKENTYDTITN